MGLLTDLLGDGNGPSSPQELTAGVANMGRQSASTSRSWGAAGRASFFYFDADKSLTVDNLHFQTWSPGAAGATLARIGLYTADASDNLTLVARSANDTSIATATFSLYGVALDTTGGYPATYDIVEGQRYAIGLVFVGTTTQPGILSAMMTGAAAATAPRMSGFLASQTDLPSSVTAGSLGALGDVAWVAAT